MKQQFLNDSGLTELIGYIKKYVKDEQDVKPYASLSVFPKTGEQNIIYIDTTVNASYYWDDTSKTYKALDVQTWATLNGKPTTFPPEDHNHDDRYFTETEMNSKLAGKADSSHTHKKADITDFPTSMPASDVYSWAKASSKPSYSWGEISGKPGTFTPSSHSHDYVVGSYTGNGGQQKPNYFGTNKVGFLMMDTTVNGNSEYKDWMIMDSYSGGDVGGAVAIGVNRQSLHAYIMRSEAKRDAWSQSAELLHTSNYTTYTVTKTGSGASGTWGINVTGSAGSVAWGNVSGKPSTFAPSTHTHGQYYDSGISRTANTVLAAPNGSAGGATFRKLVAADIPTLTKSKISDFPTSMPASDVYSWAKASSKPGYSWGEISGKPSSFTPSAHTHNYAGSSSAGGNANWANGASYASYAIKTACNPTEDKSTNGLFMFQYSENTTICPDSAWWSVVRTQHAGYNNGYWQEMAYRFDSDIIKFRRNVNGSKSAWKTIAFTDSKVSSAGYADSAGSANSVAWGNVSGKPSTYTPSSHSHNYAGSGSAGGSANSAVKLDTSTAGSATQPVYFTGGKPAACSYTLGKSVPSNAVFTDTNTWRPCVNNLSSTATDQSLSAAQGKVLNDKLNKTFPIGYIFIWCNKKVDGNTISGAPDLTTAEKVAAHFGVGTWQRIDGRFLLGYSSSYGVGTTGGAATVALDAGNIPSHNHSIPALSGYTNNTGSHSHNVKARYTNNCATKSSGAARANGGGSALSDERFGVTTDSGAHSHTVATYASTSGSTGSGTAHNNMPPYFAVYIWQRVA